MVVETLLVEHFKVHHKGHKPSLTLGCQWRQLINRLMNDFGSKYGEDEGWVERAFQSR